MEYLALYRKYRPTKFVDVVGQDNIIKIIHNSIVNNKISHAYLLCGPRGTGKTTTAKLIARMINCENIENGEPCGKCRSCNSINNNTNDDIIEIDAASNNGVDEIREIRDKVNLVPSISKYKVYIIDEVHMLSTGAFNALLKTLEEPPKHVVFILATTEEQKIPLTIVSRCQKFNFVKLSVDNIVKRLRDIADLEKITVDEDVLIEIARFSDGGMRDAISMFDQLLSSSSGNISINDVYEINGILSFSSICDFFIILIEQDLTKILKFVDNADANGKNLNKLLDEILLILRDILIFKNCPELIVDNSKKDNISKIAELYDDNDVYYFIKNIDMLISDIKTSTYPKVLIQVFFIKFVEYLKEKNDVLENKNISQEHFLKTDDVKNIDINNKNYFPGNKNAVKEENEIVEKSITIYSDKLKKIRINNALALADKNCLLNLKSNWYLIGEFLLDDKYGVVAGLLKDTMPVVAGGKFVILVSENLSVLTRLNDLCSLAEKFFEKFFGIKYKIVVINNNEWSIEKNRFVQNKKNNIKYQVLDEQFNDDMTTSLPFKSKKSVNNDVNNLINIVGNDIIEYK